MTRSTPNTAPRWDLRHHGDQDIRPGQINFAVNILDTAPPSWLVDSICADIQRWSQYPDPDPAVRAIARRYQIPESMICLTSGAAEASTLIARALPGRHIFMVHPQFTEPEAALVAAGRTVHQVITRPDLDFALDETMIPEQADLVFIGNPTNPTGHLYSTIQIEKLLRPGRLVVVDEAFMDFLNDAHTMISPQMNGVVVIRSFTKLFSIPGIRAGAVIAEEQVINALRAVQPPWSVSAPAISAIEACCGEKARAFVAQASAALPARRADLIARLADFDVRIINSQAPFILACTGKGWSGSIYDALCKHGMAVRRGETFPGLDERWIRLAVRTEREHRLLHEALDAIGFPKALGSVPIHTVNGDA